MAWLPISQTVPQYEDANGNPASGFVLKAYEDGTTTNIVMATDNTGNTTVASIALNSLGYPEVSGSIVIPHIDQSYKLALYPTQAAADADSGATWSIDNLNAAIASATDLDVKVSVSANDTTPGFLNGKLVAGDGITLTEESDGGNETFKIASGQVVNTQTGAVATGTTLLPSDSSIPQITEGDEYMTLAITPKNASNKLKIEVVISLAHSTNTSVISAALFQDSTANALAAMDSAKAINANQSALITFTHFMTAGTTSATTFRVRAGNGNAGTTTFNGRSGSVIHGEVMASSITITEIAA